MHSAVPDLFRIVADFVATIPKGRVATYGDVARWLGDVKAARWLGEWARDHEHSSECACHRLVRSTGELGGYVTVGDEKRHRLRSDGVAFCGDLVDLDQTRMSLSEPKITPLGSLRMYQTDLANQRTADPLEGNVETVGGIDLSYVPGTRTRRAVACLVCLDARSAELMWSETITDQIDFPYITSYLAFRELPLMCDVIEFARKRHPLPDVLLVDGSGILHPRRAGIAVLLGIESSTPTIGVSKKRLLGEYDESQLDCVGNCEVMVEGECRGYVIAPRTKSKRPCFASPGSGLDVEDALTWTNQMMRTHRVPEPIYWADRLSRSEATRRQ